MNARVLLETLRSLEVALHQPEVRSDRAKLDRLLHPGFREFARSGRFYTRDEILAEFSEQRQTYAIWSQEFRVEPLSEELAWLTYKSAHINGEGELERHTHRSSLWQRMEDGWQLVFHQGTPTEAFSKEAT